MIAGCAPSRPEAERAATPVSGRSLGYATNDQRIQSFVSWLQSQGVILEYRPEVAEGHGVWRLAQPKTSDEYDVVFHIRSFPAWASEEQMREAIDVNLAFMLNAPEHLAMSYAGIAGTHPEAKVPETEEQMEPGPVVAFGPVVSLLRGNVWKTNLYHFAPLLFRSA